MNRLLFPALVVMLIGASLGALCVGEIPVTLDTAAKLISGVGNEPAVTALAELRLPRVVLAIVIGSALAQSGAVMQALFRNPLADPGLIGVSAGSALAAAVVFVLIAPLHSGWVPFLLPVAAFVGGLAATAAVGVLASEHGYTRMSTLLLAGAAINAFVAAAVGLLVTSADSAALRSFTLWMFGNLGRAGWTEIAVVAPILVMIVFRLPREARSLDALLLGDAEAAHLGVAVERTRRRLMLLAVLATACSVALAGLIGFVGLIVPHAIRLLAGPGHARLLPASALLGALLLLLADTFARTAASPAELPVGVLTALIGAPFFLMLLVQWRGRSESL